MASLLFILLLLLCFAIPLHAAPGASCTLTINCTVDLSQEVCFDGTCECNVGYFQEGALCKGCAAGSAKGALGNQACTLCQAGKYQPNTAQEICLLCDPNSIGTGMTECTYPTSIPTSKPSARPSSMPSGRPSTRPSTRPSSVPTSKPTTKPSARPSSIPSGRPSTQPSTQPSSVPTSKPSGRPSTRPSTRPSSVPTSIPTTKPSARPSSVPTTRPSGWPTQIPSSAPSNQPSSLPSAQPSGWPTSVPTVQPSSEPSTQPSSGPSSQPSTMPTSSPSNADAIRNIDCDSSGYTECESQFTAGEGICHFLNARIAFICASPTDTCQFAGTTLYIPTNVTINVEGGCDLLFNLTSRGGQSEIQNYSSINGNGITILSAGSLSLQGNLFSANNSDLTRGITIQGHGMYLGLTMRTPSVSITVGSGGLHLGNRSYIEANHDFNIYSSSGSILIDERVYIKAYNIYISALQSIYQYGILDARAGGYNDASYNSSNYGGTYGGSGGVQNCSGFSSISTYERKKNETYFSIFHNPVDSLDIFSDYLYLSNTGHNKQSMGVGRDGGGGGGSNNNHGKGGGRIIVVTGYTLYMNSSSMFQVDGQSPSDVNNFGGGGSGGAIGLIASHLKGPGTFDLQGGNGTAYGGSGGGGRMTIRTLSEHKTAGRVWTDDGLGNGTWSDMTQIYNMNGGYAPSFIPDPSITDINKQIHPCNDGGSGTIFLQFIDVNEGHTLQHWQTHVSDNKISSSHVLVNHNSAASYAATIIGAASDGQVITTLTVLKGGIVATNETAFILQEIDDPTASIPTQVQQIESYMYSYVYLHSSIITYALLYPDFMGSNTFSLQTTTESFNQAIGADYLQFDEDSIVEAPAEHSLFNMTGKVINATATSNFKFISTFQILPLYR